MTDHQPSFWNIGKRRAVNADPIFLHTTETGSYVGFDPANGQLIKADGNRVPAMGQIVGEVSPEGFVPVQTNLHKIGVEMKSWADDAASPIEDFKRAMTQIRNSFPSVPTAPVTFKYPGHVSQPSTSTSPSKSNKVQENPYGLGLDPDLLNPPGGEYPYFEWSDLTYTEQMKVIESVFNSECMGLLIPITSIRRSTRDVLYRKCYRTPGLNLSEVKVICLKHAVALKTARDGTPSRPPKTFLRAEGNQMKKAMEWLPSMYSQEVIFHENVPRFTCLNGQQQPAKGGEMLMYVTVTVCAKVTHWDAIRSQMVTIYKAKAIPT